MVSIEEGLIKEKIKSYIYQDCENLGMNAECKEKSNESLPKNYIEVNDVKILFEVQDNKCYICKEPFKEYNAGCKNQLTLDRINSKNPHLKGNILLACWYCNCYGYNRQRECKYKCCSKSTSLRMKKDVPTEEILDLIDKYNKKINGTFSPNDDWKDYEGDGKRIEVDDEGFTHTTFVSERASQNYFKMKFEFELYEHNNHKCGYYPISRREREMMDAASTKEGYCKCGRKDEEGSYGCIRYPSCINDSGDDGFY